MKLPFSFKTEKISNIRKAIKKFKNVFKKHGKKIIAGLLVAAATIGGALSIKSCTNLIPISSLYKKY